MIQKDEMYAVFKTLRSVDRIEILCCMFQLCVPQELRFVASCLEDLIQKNYKLLFDAECIANDSKQLKEIAKPSNKIDKEFCASLNTYISLLHSDNTSCAIAMFSILNDLKIFFETQLAENVSSNLSSLNNEFLEDIKLIFTMASYHPAFTITQRLKMYEVCKSLKDILKYNNPYYKECPGDPSGDDGSANESRCWPAFIDADYSDPNQNGGDEQVVLNVIWSDGTTTNCLKSNNEIQIFHLQLHHAFPNLKELDTLDCFLPINSSSSSPDSYSSCLNGLKKYLQKLTKISKDVVECRLLTNFLCNSVIKTTSVNSQQ